MFQILIDTGGTFTDCIATAPNGQTLRAKVLSSSFLRGKIVDILTDNQIQVSHNWDFDTSFLIGFSFRIVGQTEFTEITKIEGDIWTLVESLQSYETYEGSFFEITSHEEAPILATRIVTQTALGQQFPALQMRLGTTKGTNALLERKGAKVALFVTKGFKDLLRIGTQQRPNLFQLAIPEPTLLYDQVIEIDERLDADGEVVSELRITNYDLRLAGLGESVAISLMHSYKNSVHEQLLKTKIQRPTLNVQFPKLNISLSSSLSPSINYLRRTQTAVVNAYLQPILSEYLTNIIQQLNDSTLNKSVTQQLSQPPLNNSVAQSLSNLLVMNSAGGLVKAQNFDAKDSLLSGPAGGMVGAAAIAQRLGFERCLTFDMGGTSTDTARFDGRLDLQFITKIDGIELHNPTLAIETVAAGGGSICSFDGQRLRVGPESAGANPGPACYGAGGPLTITDVNLLLGKLDASRFGIPVQIEKSRDVLQKIRIEIEQKSNQNLSDNDILKGFEQIANEKMAEAIRRISVARGFDPKDYPLLAFGGAGGLHGCQLAEILGITTVILPYDAGLLSAYGMGQARIERIASRQVLQNLDNVDLPKILTQLNTEATEKLKNEGVLETITTAELLYLRFKGQENTIEIEAPPLAPPRWVGDLNQDTTKLKAIFKQKFKQLYGYCPDNLTIEVESVKVIVGEVELTNKKSIKQQSNNSPTLNNPTTQQRHNSTLKTIYNWDDLQPNDTFDGPAILLNATSTSYIPAGWSVVITELKDAVAAPPAPDGGAIFKAPP